MCHSIHPSVIMLTVLCLVGCGGEATKTSAPEQPKLTEAQLQNLLASTSQQQAAKFAELVASQQKEMEKLKEVATNAAKEARKEAQEDMKKEFREFRVALEGYFKSSGISPELKDDLGKKIAALPKLMALQKEKEELEKAKKEFKDELEKNKARLAIADAAIEWVRLGFDSKNQSLPDRTKRFFLERRLHELVFVLPK